MTLPKAHWREMTTREFSDSDTSEWIAVLPIAAIEQHGPHLPVGGRRAAGRGDGGARGRRAAR